MFLADGTISQTIIKEQGLGPYYHVVIWEHTSGTFAGQLWTGVFSFYADAKEYADNLTTNGHKVIRIDLAVDRTRRQSESTVKP